MEMQLQKILEGIEVVSITGEKDVMVPMICFDSRKIESGGLFVAFKGTAFDGHNFIKETIAAGAKTILCEALPEAIQSGVTYVLVKDSQKALGRLATNFYEHPTKKMKLVGVTGTNGKTSIVTLLYQLFISLGYKAGLLSTVKNMIADKKVGATHTTPDPIQLNALLSDMVEAGCDYCFMEVSSHAAHQKRIEGLEFVGGVFTNLTRDHLDYHGSFKEYLTAKKSFFDGLPEHAFAISNFDDKNGEVMLQNTKASKYGYALKTLTDFKGLVIETTIQGMQLRFNKHDLWIRLTGNFNAYNMLAVYASAILLEQENEQVLAAISNLMPVRGRFELVYGKDNKTGIVDYAHTPDALQNVLDTINNLKMEGQQVITIVGAGGNRDKGKRPQMAAIAIKSSDKVILTSDNPRFEDPEDIIKDMEAGIPAGAQGKVLQITNRKEAIKTACMLAPENAIVLVAGKGHEDYQEVQGVKHHFDDCEVLQEYIKQ